MPTRCSGEKVRRQMAHAGLSTTKLIKLSGVSESTIRRILADKEYTTSDYTLQHIAEALQCSPFDLLRDEAISETIKTEADFTLSGVVAAAVMEAVTVVTDNVAPDATPEVVAEAVPPMQVSPPPALDIPTYLDYIKQSSEGHIESLKQSRNTWRTIAVVLFVLLLFAMGYFLWELFHPNRGLTNILWQIYSTTAPISPPKITPIV